MGCGKAWLCFLMVAGAVLRGYGEPALDELQVIAPVHHMVFRMQISCLILHRFSSLPSDSGFSFIQRGESCYKTAIIIARLKESVRKLKENPG